MSQILATLLAATLFLPVAQADRPIPETEWTPEARIQLARCMVAEAGWDTRNHDAIGWALSRSWTIRGRDSGRTFQRQIELYCAVFRTTRPTERQLWVRELPDGPMTAENRSSHWQDGDWTAFNEAWLGVLAFVDRWALGEVPDTCPRASDWGGDGVDSIPLDVVEVCRRGREGRRNIFFYFDGAAQRQRIYCAQLRRRYEGAAVIPVEVATCLSSARRRREQESVPVRTVGLR